MVLMAGVIVAAVVDACDPWVASSTAIPTATTARIINVSFKIDT